MARETLAAAASCVTGYAPRTPLPKAARSAPKQRPRSPLGGASLWWAASIQANLAAPMTPASFRVRPLSPADAPWVRELVTQRWGGEAIAVHGELFHPAELPGYVAQRGQSPIGLVTFRFDAERSCEIITLDSVQAGVGVGTALVGAVLRAAEEHACPRVWLVTTNDNLPALRFWQRRGFRLVALHRDAVTRARLRKPSIPTLGHDGIPIRDELELERRLDA